MMSRLAKNIIIRALKIRKERGEDLVATLNEYKKLTREEKEEILKEVER